MHDRGVLVRIPTWTSDFCLLQSVQAVAADRPGRRPFIVCRVLFPRRLGRLERDTEHSSLAPRLRMTGAAPPLPPPIVPLSCAGAALSFTLQNWISKAKYGSQNLTTLLFIKDAEFFFWRGGEGSYTIFTALPTSLTRQWWQRTDTDVTSTALRIWCDFWLLIYGLQ